jgi:hypothetical protein
VRRLKRAHNGELGRDGRVMKDLFNTAIRDPCEFITSCDAVIKLELEFREIKELESHAQCEKNFENGGAGQSKVDHDARR